MSAKAVIDAADTTLFGSTSGKSGAALGYLRWGKETFANVRPCRYLPGCASPLRHPEGIDFVIVRENLEDLYVGAEGPLEDLAALNLVGRSIRKPVHELGGRSLRHQGDHPGRYRAGRAVRLRSRGQARR